MNRNSRESSEEPWDQEEGEELAPMLSGCSEPRPDGPPLACGVAGRSEQWDSASQTPTSGWTQGGHRDPALASRQGCRHPGKEAAMGPHTANPGSALTMTSLSRGTTSDRLLVYMMSLRTLMRLLVILLP